MSEEGKQTGTTGAKRPVVSSVTGKPMDLDETAPKAGGSAAKQGSGGNDARLLRDVPPHWG